MGKSGGVDVSHWIIVTRAGALKNMWEVEAEKWGALTDVKHVSAGIREDAI